MYIYILKQNKNMGIFTLKQKIFIIKRYYQTGNSTKIVQNEFPSEFNHYISPTEDNIQELVQLFEEFGTVLKIDDEEIEAIYETPNRCLEDANKYNDADGTGIKVEPTLPIFETRKLVEQVLSNTVNKDQNNFSSDYSCSDEEDEDDDEMDKSYSTSEELKQRRFNLNIDECHEKGGSNRTKLILKCKDCDKEFDRRARLLRHMNVHKNRCEICGKKFHDREKHMKKHTGEKTFLCSQCDARFINVSRLNHHMIGHSTERPFECEICHKTFKSTDGLRGHKKTHSTERPHKCDQCAKGFLNKGDLTKHQNVHTGRKPAVCQVCGKGFSSNDSLKVHMRTHTGEKPYECQYCGKQFSCSNVLKIHIRVHTGEKPYKCKYCEKAFADSSTCRAHERTHTGDYPYKCHICGKTCNQSSNLKSHLRHAHGHE